MAPATGWMWFLQSRMLKSWSLALKRWPCERWLGHEEEAFMSGMTELGDIREFTAPSTRWGCGGLGGGGRWLSKGEEVGLRQTRNLPSPWSGTSQPPEQWELNCYCLQATQLIVFCHRSPNRPRYHLTFLNTLGLFSVFDWCTVSGIVWKRKESRQPQASFWAAPVHLCFLIPPTDNCALA